MATNLHPAIRAAASIAIALAGSTFCPPGARAQAPSVVWASAAHASSQYGDPDWAAHQATGAPNTSTCGDIVTAWASRGADDKPEWLDLEFPSPVRTQAVRIVETYHPGAVRRIDGFDGGWVTLWSGRDPNAACPGVAEIVLARPRTLRRIRVYLDSPAVAGWNEIDAVGLVPVGAPRLSPSGAAPVQTIAAPSGPALAYAARARASSEFGAPAWAAHQATGAPNSPACGDQHTAWASRTPDSQPEWLELDFDTPVRARAVLVRETYNPGAVRMLEGHVAGRWVTLWSGQDPNQACPGSAELPFSTPTMLSRIRLHVDSPAVAGWNEIDAVALVPESAPVTTPSSPPSPKLPRGNIVWASSATAGTQYGDPQWAAAQATGQPDTLTCGDLASAWASRTPDDQPEWLEAAFPRRVNARAIVVTETFNPGALVRIDEVGPSGVRALWSGRDPNSACPGHAVIPLQGDRPLRRIRLHFDSPAVAGWNEIDAVGLLE